MVPNERVGDGGGGGLSPISGASEGAETPPSWERAAAYHGFMPGYTGHCPGLRDEGVGMTFGNATRKCLRQRRSLSAPGTPSRRGLRLDAGTYAGTERHLAASSAAAKSCTRLLALANGYCSNGGGVAGSNGLLAAANGGTTSPLSSLRPKTAPAKDGAVNYRGTPRPSPSREGGNRARKTSSARSPPSTRMLATAQTNGSGTGSAGTPVGMRNGFPATPLRPLQVDVDGHKRILELVRANEAKQQQQPSPSVQPIGRLSRPSSPLQGAIDPITGYTGHIPSLAFVTGKPFCIAKEECLRQHKQTQQQHRLSPARSTPALLLRNCSPSPSTSPPSAATNGGAPNLSLRRNGRRCVFASPPPPPSSSSSSSLSSPSPSAGAGPVSPPFPSVTPLPSCLRVRKGSGGAGCQVSHL